MLNLSLIPFSLRLTLAVLSFTVSTKAWLTQRCCYDFRGKKCKPLFTQIARQVVELKAADLRLPARAWKVKLVGEGADDAGGKELWKHSTQYHLCTLIVSSE